MNTVPIPTANELKHNLRKQGYNTIKAWANEKGFSPRAVSDVVRGLRRGVSGDARDIRIALGLPVPL